MKMDIRSFFKTKGGGGKGGAALGGGKSGSNNNAKKTQTKNDVPNTTKKQVKPSDGKKGESKSKLKNRDGASTKKTNAKRRVLDDDDETTDEDAPVATTNEGVKWSSARTKPKEKDADEDKTDNDLKDSVQQNNEEDDALMDEPVSVRPSRSATKSKKNPSSSTKTVDKKEIRVSAEDFFAAAMGKPSPTKGKGKGNASLSHIVTGLDPKELAKQKLREEMARDEAELDKSEEEDDMMNAPVRRIAGVATNSDDDDDDDDIVDLTPEKDGKQTSMGKRQAVGKGHSNKKHAATGRKKTSGSTRSKASSNSSKRRSRSSPLSDNTEDEEEFEEDADEEKNEDESSAFDPGTQEDEEEEEEFQADEFENELNDDDNNENASTKKKSSKRKNGKGRSVSSKDAANDMGEETGVRRSPRRTKNKAPVRLMEEEEEDDDEKDTKRQSTPKRRKVDDDEEEDIDMEVSGENKRTSKSKTTKVAPRQRKTTPASSSTRKGNKKSKAPMPKEPLASGKVITLDDIKSSGNDLLEGYAFVFTGVLPSLSRDDSMDYVKSLGGRVTSAISGKTDYLVCGLELEDGRPYTEGSKYRKASEIFKDKCNVLVGEEWFYSLIKMLDDEHHGVQKEGSDIQEAVKMEKVKDEDEKEEDEVDIAPNSQSTTASSTAVVNPYLKKPNTTINNPYAKKTGGTGITTSTVISNPYIKNKSAIVNPYAKKPVSGGGPVNPYAKKPINGGGVSDHTDPDDANDPRRGQYALWADKYAPRNSGEILGNNEAVRKLRRWLDDWERTFNNARSKGKSFSAPNGPWKAALLSGPPGIGKSTTAMLVAKEAGRDVVELNASDTRSKKTLQEGLGDVTGSQVLNFGSAAAAVKQNGKKGGTSTAGKKRCIIMDEVDGMGAGDRSGIAELIQMIKHSMVPIVCICNDRQSQKIRSLVPYCLDLRYRRPVKSVIGRRAVEVASREGLRVEPNAAEAIAESCGNDIRQVLNVLQMWASKKNAETGTSMDMTYRELKQRQHEINKDDMLRVSLFDATKLIVEGPRGTQPDDLKSARDSLFKRTDAFFIDYNLIGLNVHQNYLKVLVGPFGEAKRSKDPDNELQVLERMSMATESMSDFGLVEQKVRGGDMNWSLLPFCSILAVKTGSHAGGERGGFLPGYPEFSEWLGKNSSRGKMKRLLQELHYHMNFKVSGDATELRLRYLPVFRKEFLNLLQAKDGPQISEVIDMMDEYGLDRDDLFENLDLFTLESKPSKFTDLDSKAKAAFTREYNQRAHTSQALVAEQGMTKTGGRGKSGKQSSSEGGSDPGDLDAVNDDKNIESDDNDDEDDDDDDDAEKIRQQFMKKKRANSKKKSTDESGTTSNRKRKSSTGSTGRKKK